MKAVLQWLRQRLRQPLETCLHLWTESPLPAFFAWWGGELGQMLPERWYAWFSTSSYWYLLQHDQGHWVVHRPGESRPLARWKDTLESSVQQGLLTEAISDVSGQDQRLALCIHTNVALRRCLTLPLAARDNLRQVGAFEMDRQTPFRVEQVYYDIRELTSDALSGRFHAELVVVPRDVLDLQLQRLREVGITIDAVDLTDGDRRLGVNLLPPEQARVRRDPRRRLNLVLAAGITVLLLMCMGQWLHNRRMVLVAMQAQVDGMKNQARHIVLLRQKLRENIRASGFLLRYRMQKVPVIDLLRDLTALLPDSTWLERLELDSEGHLQFQGQSAKAAGLLEVLQHDKFIVSPTFQGTIQRVSSSGNGKERFYMHAKVRTPMTGKNSKTTESRAGDATASRAGAKVSM